MNDIKVELSKKNYIELNNKDKISNTKLTKEDLFSENGTNLLKSPTNSGKTYYVLNEYKKLIKDDEFVILVVPTKVLYRELIQNENVYGFYDSFDRKEVVNKRVIVCIYDKLSKLINHQFTSFDKSEISFKINKSHVFIDEAHNLYTAMGYRENILMMIKDLTITNKNFKKTILMSGTFANKLIDIDTIVELKRTKKIEKDCKIHYSDKPTKSCIDLVIKNYKEDNSRVQIIYKKNTKDLERLALAFNKENIKSVVLTSDKQTNKEFKGLYEDKMIDSDVKILLMTNVGEEGISILNENLYCVHTIDKINSTTAEQLSNRGRNVKPILNIHCKDSIFVRQFIDIPKKTLEHYYNEEVNSANRKVKNGLTNFKSRAKEPFMEFCIWNNEEDEISLSSLKISYELYENDSKNELNFYDLYFIKKLEILYGFNVYIIKGSGFVNELVIPNIEKVNMALEIFDIYIKDTNCKLEDFISENEDKYDVNVLEVAYFDFKTLSGYFESDTIKKYIKKMNRETKSIQYLKDYIFRKQNGNTEIENWLFDNIKEDTTYSNMEIDYLLSEYSLAKGSFKRITRTGFKKIIKTYFEVEEKRINKSKNVDKAYTRFSTKKRNLY